MKTVASMGESGVIARLCRRLPDHEDLVVGAGDDCAVVRSGVGDGCDWVLTSDAVIEGVHFAGEAAAEDVGHKAVGRVLSDIAAMGAEPVWGLIDLVAAPDTPVEKVDRVYAGAMALAAQHGFVVVGGDVARGSGLELHVFGLGRVPTDAARLRSAAGAGDGLFVTGSLGGSRSGKHLRIEPRVQEGLWLRDWASAMIDVSDGLATDVRHLVTSSGVGCDLAMADIPIAAAAQQAGDGRSAVDHALCDGEDFELLFTVAAGRVDAFMAAWDAQSFSVRCTRIGGMTGRTGVIRCLSPDGTSQELTSEGYAHFV